MLTRPPSLRAVAAFEAAARHQSFAKAGDELSLTHSAISHAVRTLELRLGAQLFTRVGRTVTLTDEGAGLAKRVRASLSLLSDALDRPSHPERSRLAIGVDVGLGARLLAPRLADFQARHPQIELELRGVVSSAALAASEVDLVIRAGTGCDLGVASRVLARERLWPMAAPAVAADCDLGEIGSAVLIESRQHPWSLWAPHSRGKPAAGAAALFVDSDLWAIEVAKAGGGICLAPSLLVQGEIAAGALVRLGSDEAAARSAYNLDWIPSSGRLAEISLFAAWLTEALAISPRAPARPWTRQAESRAVAVADRWGREGAPWPA